MSFPIININAIMVEQQQQMPDLLPCSEVKSTASSFVLFRVTCSDSCTHVRLTRHHFTLRCPYAAQLLAVTLVRLQLWQQNRVNDIDKPAKPSAKPSAKPAKPSAPTCSKCALQIQMTSHLNRLTDCFFIWAAIISLEKLKKQNAGEISRNLVAIYAFFLLL